MLFIGLLQSIFSAIVFLLRKPRHSSNFVLSFWFLIFSLFFLGLLLPEGLTTYTKVGFVPFFMLSGPVFYFYVRSLIYIHSQFQWVDLVHLIPFVLVSILRVIYLPESMSPKQYADSAFSAYHLIAVLLFGASFLAYWVATLVLLFRHNKNILNFFSTRSGKRTLSWVSSIMLIALLSHVLFLAAPFLLPYFTSIANMSFWLHQFNMAMLSYTLLVFGLMQPVIYAPELRSAESEADDLLNEKYYRSGLSKAVMQRYAQSITEYLEKEKPYTNPEYSLQSMIRDVNISQQNLSQTINEALGKNFYQLINEYRVREFKNLLQDPKSKNFTLLGLAYEAGFNSKSSFNRIFKETTGQTPSQYQQTLNR
ncbi:AraC-like DNA-binding protein [Catalinimonas alkaloidigena]|uniref:helix-turn-helix domain-containing protein n=1 Tax=Catalinimonas alkaloidigena TaxID=1075417 RepID=UPI0024067C32|nr:helix-turn-helix domain-containing protein [Catalinimonas alkaloidigena]MDF9800990.1 AraC-like DNA-binding protein [Catalinimonas alkaloidigena]